MFPRDSLSTKFLQTARSGNPEAGERYCIYTVAPVEIAVHGDSDGLHGYLAIVMLSLKYYRTAATLHLDWLPGWTSPVHRLG